MLRERSLFNFVLESHCVLEVGNSLNTSLFLRLLLFLSLTSFFPGFLVLFDFLLLSLISQNFLHNITWMGIGIGGMCLVPVGVGLLITFRHFVDVSKPTANLLFVYYQIWTLAEQIKLSL
jgi:hypothetical protein